MNSKKLASIFLVIGVIITIVAPWLFTKPGLINFSDTGQIGDTIGGITAPISSILGAVLVYLALGEQVKANKIIQQQIDESKRESTDIQLTQHFIDRLKMMRQDLAEFTRLSREITRTGTEAINVTLNVMLDLNWGCDHQDIDLKFKEFYQVVAGIKALLVDIKTSQISAKSGRMLVSLISQEFIVRVQIPVQKKRATAEAQQQHPCYTCGKKHYGIPLDIFYLTDQIDGLLSDMGTEYFGRDGIPGITSDGFWRWDEKG